MVPRRDHKDDDTTAINVAVYARVSTGLGNVLFTTQATPGGAVLNVTGTSFAWHSTTIDAYTEDYSNTGGAFPNGSWEELGVQTRKVSGGSISIAAVMVWES